MVYLQKSFTKCGMLTDILEKRNQVVKYIWKSQLKLDSLEYHPKGFNDTLIHRRISKEEIREEYYIYFSNSFNHKIPISLISGGICNP